MQTVSEPLDSVISDLKTCLKSLQSRDPVTENPKHSHKCSGQNRQKSDRFLINLYEGRFSSNERRKIQHGKGKLWPVSDKDDVFGKDNDYLCTKKRTMERYVTLRSQRDVECIKMKEASKILQHLSAFSPFGHWNERLLAEKMLLESGIGVDILREKIREDYVRLKEKDLQIGTLSVSNFKFQVTNPTPKPNETEFFILILTNDSEVKSSKIARATNGELVFHEKFAFRITRNFRPKLQLYSIVMKETPKFFALGKFFYCKDLEKRAATKLQFKNVNTCDFEEIKVLKSSFQLRAETEITASNLHNLTWKLNLSRDSSVHDLANFSAMIDKFHVENKTGGFLTLGRKIKETVLWNRSWCVLDSCLLKIYNCPGEEDFVDPHLTIDLESCGVDSVGEAPRTFCNRPRSIMIDVDGNEAEKYFLMADNCDDLRKWIGDLNLVLDLLRFKASLMM